MKPYQEEIGAQSAIGPVVFPSRAAQPANSRSTDSVLHEEPTINSCVGAVRVALGHSISASVCLAHPFPGYNGTPEN